jgi:ABC-type polysaccharide/polyol phosphate export permease
MVNVALMLLFYLTPVFYKAEAIPLKYRVLYTLNPMAVLVQSYRAIFFYGSAPDWYPVLFTFCLSLGVLALGYFVYSRELSDVIDAI